MWIARDRCGVACLYNTKPTREENVGCWFVEEDLGIGDNPAWEYLQILEQFDTFTDLKWEDEPIEVEIKDKISEQIIKETTTGITKKELIELLSDYPDDANVIVECCNIKQMKYCEKDNTIRID